MRQIKIIPLLFLMMLLVFSCIKPYYPDISSKDTNKYVVSGEVSDEDEIQTVTISKTSPIGDPEFIEVPGCTVTILDDHGNSFPMTDMGAGEYSVTIDKSYITPGTSFKVDITTPENIRIVSDFDKVSPSPAIDSIYFVRKSIPTPEPGIYHHGIQFYVDLNGTASDSKYFRWESVETFEYHAEYPLMWYYDGSVHFVWPPDYSKDTCWRTDIVPSIYTLSTAGLSENKYKMLPLHYVDNKTERLSHGYSLLLQQFALSEDAYIYWDKMRINSNGQSGLYEKQPMPVRGNLHNQTHPDEEVLGFFGASSVTTKRVFTGPIPGLVMDYPPSCGSQWLGIGGFKNIDPSEYPAPLVGDEHTYTMWVMNNACVDCTVLGGTLVKPDFWPK